MHTMIFSSCVMLLQEEVSSDSASGTVDTTSNSWAFMLLLGESSELEFAGLSGQLKLSWGNYSSEKEEILRFGQTQEGRPRNVGYMWELTSGACKPLVLQPQSRAIDTWQEILRQRKKKKKEESR